MIKRGVLYEILVPKLTYYLVAIINAKIHLYRVIIDTVEEQGTIPVSLAFPILPFCGSPASARLV